MAKKPTIGEYYDDEEKALIESIESHEGHFKSRLMPAGFMLFDSTDELQQFIDAENSSLEAEREKYEPFDVKKFLSRPRTKKQEEDWLAEKSKNGDFLQWLNDNRRQYDSHEWEPGVNEYLEFFLGKVNQLPYDKLTVDGTYEITTPPPSQQLTLPHLQIIKKDTIFDVVYDFGIEPCYLLRTCQVIPGISKLSLFISRYPPHPRNLQLLTPYEGEQSVLAINTEMDLYAVLTILLNEPLLSETEKKQAKLEALEVLENIKPSKGASEKSSVELVQEMRERRARELSE